MDFSRFAVVLVAVMACGMGTPLMAQVPPNCTIAQVTEPARQVLKCAFGLTIELEAAAQMDISGDILPTEPTGINLQKGAAFIDVEPGAARPQIRTPHAIAAVRGTVYVVDVTQDKTSVFVVQGAVTVSAQNDDSVQAILGPGQGVDVDATADLIVKTWPQKRVRALLARFGR